MVEIARRGQKTLSRLPGQGSDWATARPLTAFQSRRGGGHDLPSNLVALEPRVMLDGAAAIAAIAETVDNDDQAAEAQEDGSSGANPQTEQNGEPGSESDNSGNPGGPESAPNDDPAIIVIVDAAIKDPETLLTGLDPSAEVFYLNPGEDGVARIATILSGFSEVGALHILSHGAEGSVTLGATTLDLGTIESHASGLAAWGAALGRDADVLLYGCNVGAASGGRAFIEIFADLTGADVSASTDVTGSQAAGGDWTLETATGDIEATAPFASAALTGYAHLLMTAPPEFTGDLADGNETIAIDEHTAAGNAVFDVDANDGNGGLPDAGVTFSITAGNTDTDGDGTDAFAIDAVTGVIAVADADDLDFEDVATFTLTVQADDGGPTDNLSTATVTINLNDIGDIFTVTTLADEGFSFPGGTLASETNDGEGLSLREAISLVNATGGSGTANLIVFDPTLAGGTITLTDGIDALNRQLVIGLDTIVKIDGDTDGDEAADITISAADFSRVFSVNGADLRLDSLTITGGAESAIATSNSDLTIVNSTLTGNTSTGGQGGALSNFGSTTTIVNSTISENTSTGANAISNSSGTVTLVNTTIANNTGTSNLIANTGTLEIFNSTFSGNRGSLFNFGVGQISAANSILSETAFNSLANVTLNGRNIVGTNIFDGAVDVGDTSPNQIFASVATSPLTGLLQGVLANNRGPVRTIAILENGDAHDTGISANLPGDAADLDGDNDTSEQVPVDARGFDRIFGATVDLGATERLVGVNTVPDSTDSTVTVTEDVTYTFTLTDFPFIDADPGDQLLNVRIETLPDAAAGQFLLNGTPVTIGQIIDRSDIIAGALTFTPTADLSGAPATAFNFSVSDGLDFQASPNTLTIDIAAIADTPGVTIGLDSAFTFGTPVDVGNGPRQVVDLAAFDASLGFIVISDIAGDGIGFSVSEAGDVNGDGFADIILGASRGDDGGIDAGEAYVLFGTDQGFGSPSGANRVVDLTNLSAAQGFIIQGDVAGGLAGSAVSGAGDVNGDGFDDVIVGALRGDVAGNDAGEAYVVFGSDQTIGTNVGGRQVVDLTTLSGTQGFVILGDQAGSLLGAGVSAAGDFNGDGFDDILVGASSSSGSGAAPATFLIFGTDQGFGTTVAGRQVLDTSVLAAGDIVRITGGSSIGGINRLAGLGDVNGDGFDDFVLGDGALPGDRAYVIFGTDQNLGTDLDLDTLGSTRGFVIEGDAAGDFFGIAVSGAGDVNRDGFADILVGASAGDDGGNSAGEAYVLFGTDQGFGTVVGSQRILSTNTLSASEGFIIQGDVADDQLGTAVSAAGDVNDDGFDDIIISALRGDDGGNDAGEAYVVFGGSGPFGTATDAGNGLRQVLDLTTLSSGQGFIVQGPGAASLTGTGVSGAGDVNGDGVPDFIVGSSVLDQAHIIFGLPAPQEDTTVGIDISATVTDALANAHSTETITALTIVGLPAGSIITDGSAVNTAVSAGPATPIDVLGWDLTNLLVTPAPDFNGALTLTVEATASESANGDAATASASLIVNFTPVPDDVVANPDTIAVVDDAPIIIDVLANDVDPDGDPITFVSLTQPAMGTASLTDIDGDGTDDAIAFTPSPGFFGASFEYTITDGSTTATTTVDITNNRPLVVSTTADEFDNDFSNGDLSLREAVFLAGQGFGTDADGNGQTDITFDAGLFGAGAAIVLNGSAITVGSAVEISGDVNGDGRADVTLDGDDTSRVLDITGSAVTLNALAITGGNSGPEDGGGIRTGVGTSVIIRNTTITGNTSGAAGGGVSNDGNLTFANTTIAGNNAVDGGGIRNFGDLTAINLTLHGNTASDRGGALFGGGTATLIHTTITANMAADSGSGAFFSTVTIGPNPYEVTNSIILGNGEAPSQSPSNIFPFFTGHNIFGQSASGPNFTSSFQPFPVHIFAELDPATGNAVLADNGGFVPTVALTADLLNIAVDIADPASVPSEQALGVDVDGDGAISASPVGIDARGLSRISGTAPDLGAFELAPFNGPFVGPLVVSTTADVFDGDFSAGNLALREATFLASQGFGTDGDNDGLTDITFDATLFGGGATITLTGREIAIGSDLAIFGDVDGDGTADVTLDGDNLSRIFLVQEGPTTALFDSLILINGETTDALNQSRRNGGAIAVEPDATATIRNSEIRDNNSAFRGGGVAGFRGSTVNIVDSLITGNEAGDSGGGLYILGSGTVSDTIIDNNTAQRGGGGITVDGNAEITSSILSNNSAIQGGGGIAVRSFFDLTTFTRVTAEVSISGSLIEGNTGGSGGGAQVDGEASFVATTIRGNEALFTEIGQPQVGGGVAVRGSATFVGTTISGNRATFGGDGVFVGDNFDPATGPVTATFVNSTIAHNPSAFGRHGLLTDGDHATTLINTTVTGNRVILDPTGTTTIANSIIFGTFNSATVSTLSGTATLLGGNIIGDTNGGQFTIDGVAVPAFANLQTGDVFVALDPSTSGGNLSDNGGPVETVAIRANPNTPVFDQGDASLLPSEQDLGVDIDGDGTFSATPIAIDARGFSRIVDLGGSGSGLDLGAFEVQAPVVADDAVTVQEDIVTTIDVLANDNAGGLAVTSVGPATNGTTSLVGGQVRYTPNSDFNGTDSFTYSVTGAFGTETATVAVTVAPVNDAPVLTGLDTTLSFMVGDQPLLIDGDVAVFDVEQNWDGGTLSVTGLAATDNVAVRSSGGVTTISGNEISVGGIPVATFTGGQNGTDLLITLNAQATSAAVEAIIENLVFSNDSFAPAAERTLLLQLTDGDGTQARGPVYATVPIPEADRPVGGTFQAGIPQFVDIDNDGDLDAFVGTQTGIEFFRNDGDPATPAYVAVSGAGNPFNSFNQTFNAGGLSNAAPSFADIDGDGDFDAFIGDNTNAIPRFFRNDGTANAPIFTLVTGGSNPFDGAGTGNNTAPAVGFVDIDNDGDLDAFLGLADGTIAFRQNDGTTLQADFVAIGGVDNPLNGIVASGGAAKPAFVDIDNDGDFDAILGNLAGTLQFLRNDGDAATPSFVEIGGSENPFDGIDVGNDSSPTFADIDNGGAPDLFVGRRDGTLAAFQGDTGFGIETTINRTLVVTTLQDEADGDFSFGDLSLREAIALAGLGIGTDTNGDGLADITFDPTLFASGETIVLSLGQLEITSDLSIDGDVDGDNRADVTIDGGLLNRVFDVTAGTVLLDSLSISGGDAGAGDGGGLRIGTAADVTIRNTTISGNQAGGDGGGIFNEGTLALANATIDNNDATNGAGIANDGGLVAVNTTLFGNRATGIGGGLYTTTDATLAHTTVAGNSADINGGVFAQLDLVQPVTFTITNSIVLGNTENILDPRDVGGTFALTPDRQGNNILAGVLFEGNVPISLPGSINVFSDIDPNTGLPLLADNGGPVRTVALRDDLLNPALDGSDPAVVPTEQDLGIDVDGSGMIDNLPIGIDARGLSRSVGSAQDLGAFEVQPLAVNFIGPLVVSTDTDIDDGDFSQGNLSLREAIRLARAGFGTDGDGDGLTDITFDAALFGGGQTITLGGTETRPGLRCCHFRRRGW